MTDGGRVITGLSVVIPCFNEVDNIAPCYREVVAELGDLDLELLFVDDGSTDGTLREITALAATDPRVHYLSFTRNFGFEAAFSAGYRYAGKPWLLHIDADQQFPADQARLLVDTAAQGYDAVFGVRTNRQDPRLRRWGTAAFHFIARRALRMELPEGATAFRVVRTSLARTIVNLRMGNPHFFATVPRLTDRYTTVLVGHRARQRGQSKVGFGWLAAHAIELFVGFTRRLATIVSTACMAAAGLSVLFGLFALAGLASQPAVFGLLAALLTSSALIIRYLAVVGSGQSRPRLYYIREANIAVDPEDQFEPHAPRESVRRRPPASTREADAPAAGSASGRTIVVIGAADGSVSTYQRAAELGYRTIAVDIRPGAPGVAHADEFVQASVRAPEQIAAALLERDDIAGVLCPASDVGLRTQAWLARHWNLPDPLPVPVVRASVDKQVFRQVCARLGLPDYGSVAGEPGPALVAAAQQLRFPALVKPVDSSGGRGVVSCPGPSRLESAFAEALAHSPSGRVVVEEYVDGDHFSVEALIEGGQVAFHAVTDRAVTPPPYFVTSAHLLPAALPAQVDEQLVDMLNAVCADLGYRTGPMTLDAVLGRDGHLYLIEMGARIGGNGLAEAVAACHGVDLVAGSIAAAVGEPLRPEPHEPRPTLVHLLTSDRAGHLTAIEGVEEVRAMPEVVRLSLFAEPGDHVRPYEQAGYKLGQVVLCADTPAALREAEAKVRGMVRFLLGEQHVAVPMP